LLEERVLSSNRAQSSTEIGAPSRPEGRGFRARRFMSRRVFEAYAAHRRRADRGG